MTGFPASNDDGSPLGPFNRHEPESAHDDWTPQERAALRQMVRARATSQTPVGEYIFSEEQVESLKEIADFWSTFQRVGVIMAAVRSGLTLVAFFVAVWLFVKGKFPDLYSIMR